MTTQIQQPNPQENIQSIVGGPGAGMEAKPGSNNQPNAPVAQQEIIVGNKRFKSMDEYNEYTIALEKEREGLKTVVEKYMNPQAQVQPAPQPQTGPKLSELMYENPDEFAKIVREQAKQEALQEIQKKEQVNTFWNNFYSENNDLKGAEDIVEIQRQKNWNSISKMSPDECKVFLAKESRTYLNKIRNVQGGGQAMPQGPAITAGASGQPAPAVPQQKPAPTDFISELRALKKNRA